MHWLISPLHSLFRRLLGPSLWSSPPGTFVPKPEGGGSDLPKHQVYSSSNCFEVLNNSDHFDLLGGLL